MEMLHQCGMMEGKWNPAHEDPQRFLQTPDMTQAPLCAYTQTVRPSPCSQPGGMHLPLRLPAVESAISDPICEAGYHAPHAWEEYHHRMHLSHPYSPYIQHQHHLGHQVHPNTIARRNARERNRVKTINSTFCKLRAHLPGSSANKKLSKVQILRSAIQYINQLASILKTQDAEMDSATPVSDDHQQVTSSSQDDEESDASDDKEEEEAEEDRMTRVQMESFADIDWL